MSSLGAIHRLLSRLKEGSLFSIKAKRLDSGRVTVKTPNKRVSILIIPCNCFGPNGGDTFGRSSLAEDAILHCHKLSSMRALITFCFAAHHAHHVDCLCEMLHDEQEKVVAYRFFFIDRAGAPPAAQDGDDDEEMDVSEDEDDDDEASEAGAIAAAGVGAGAQKKQHTFSETLAAVLERRPFSKRMQQDYRLLAEDNVLFTEKPFLDFAAGYTQNTDIVNLSIKSLTWKKGMALHQIFTWDAATKEMSRHCSIAADLLLENNYVRRPMMTEGSEETHGAEITALMFDNPDTVLKMDATTLLAPHVFCNLRRPDVDIAYSMRMRNPALSEDADLLEQIRQSAAFGVEDDNDGDVVRRRPAYVIIRNTLAESFADARMFTGPEKWEKLQGVWREAAAHWTKMTLNSESGSCPGLSMSMRSWLSFIKTDFVEHNYKPPNIPFSVDTGCISNFVLWMFANMETYLLMLKQHSNFFKLYCMMLGCTLPRENGRVLPFVCMLGPAMSSKSFLLDCLRLVFLRNTTTMVTSSTNKARTTGYELSFETVELYDEGTAGFLQTAAANSDPGIQQRQELLKQILTLNDVSHQMASSKEMPNRSKRKILVKEIWEEFNQSMAMATNHVECVDHAIKTRIHEEFFAPSRRPDKDVSSLEMIKQRGMNDPVWFAGYEKFILTMQQFQCFHNMVCAVMKSKVLPAFEFCCFNLYMSYVEARLKTWGIPLPSPRTKQRMQCLVQSLTILHCWLVCYVYEGAIFYKMPPSFNHISEWARHVSSDSSEAVLQVIAMMGHSLIGEYVAKGQVLNVLYRYLVSESCITRKFYASSVDDAKQMFTPGEDPSEKQKKQNLMKQGLAEFWKSCQRGCSWKHLMTAQAEIFAARNLKQKSPAQAKELLLKAQNRMNNNVLESVCTRSGFGNTRNADAAQPVLDALNEEIELIEERCKECDDCGVVPIKAYYVVLKQAPQKLVSSLYNFWQNNSELGEPMSEAELSRTFDVLANETMTVGPVTVLQTHTDHAGVFSTSYMPDVTGVRKTKEVVFSPIGKDRLCISLGAIVKSFNEATQGGVSVEALLSACNHKYMEENTMLLGIPSSVNEPQYPKVYRTAKTERVFKQKHETVGHVEARALGIETPQPQVTVEYKCDMDYFAKYTAMQNLGLDTSSIETVPEEGRLSSVLQRRFRECYGPAQSVEQFRESLKRRNRTVTQEFSTEQA